MKLFALSLLLILGPQSARAESLLVFGGDDHLATRRSLAEGDTLSFPQKFELENYSPEKGFAATVITGSAGRGQPYACALSLPAISEVMFTSEMKWSVVSVNTTGDVVSISMKTEQFDERLLELRCSANAPIGQALAGKGVKLEELRAHELLNDRLPASN